MRVLILLGILFVSIGQSGCQVNYKETETDPSILVGSQRMDLYLDLIKDKRVAIVGNQTTLVGEQHLVDTLLSLGIDIKKVLAPEHGFRGNASNGEKIVDGVDPKTSLPIVSLYGDQRKPSVETLSNVDIIIFDIQDVGARFYTYISTLQYVMEAAAENQKEVLVLDRPNPNGFYVDGPVLDKTYQSFVGMHEIPVVHGLTIGELAMMINGENWLGDQKAMLTVIPCLNYDHLDLYQLPVPPSPNLPNMTSVYLYPSLCFFESTAVSVGRGTDLPFQIIGYPKSKVGTFKFTPHSIPGVSEYPKYEGEECIGFDLQEFGSFYFTAKRRLYMDWIVGMYEVYDDKEYFFKENNFFDKLAGTDVLKKQIIQGKTAEEISTSWTAELKAYKKMRKKYLLYKDFE